MNLADLPLSADQLGGAAQLAAVLLSFGGVYRKLNRMHRELRQLGARVVDLEQVAASDVQRRWADEPSHTWAGRLRDRLVQRAGLALVLLGLCIAAPAGAMQQVDYNPATDPNPDTVFTGTGGQFLYAVKIDQRSLVSSFGNGWQPIILQYTTLSGSAKTVEVFDGTVYVVNSRSVRLACTVCSSAAYVVTLFDTPGEVGNPLPPPPPVGTILWSCAASAALTDTPSAAPTCITNVPVPPFTRQLRVVAYGLDATGAIPTNLTGGSLRAYSCLDTANMGGLSTLPDKFARIPALDCAVATTGSQTPGTECQVNAPPYYSSLSYYPDAVTGAAGIHHVVICVGYVASPE